MIGKNHRRFTATMTDEYGQDAGEGNAGATLPPDAAGRVFRLVFAPPIEIEHCVRYTGRMKIAKGRVFKWAAEPETKYYFIENDLVSLNDALRGLHWCRICFRNNVTGEARGYRTVLGPEYFEDLKKVVGKKLVEVTEPAEIGRLTALFNNVGAHLRGH
jgi:hypothetical protein